MSTEATIDAMLTDYLFVSMYNDESLTSYVDRVGPLEKRPAAAREGIREYEKMPSIRDGVPETYVMSRVIPFSVLV